MNNETSRFVLRIPKSLHQRLTRKAKGDKRSLNETCRSLLERGFAPQSAPRWSEKLQPLTEKIQEHFGKNLLSLAIFGSQIQGTATEASDLDLLIVLRDEIVLDRSLYSWWDLNFPDPRVDGIPVSPHFVHIPQKPEDAGGFWFEIATHHEMIWTRSAETKNLITSLLTLIREGRIQRAWTHGHPYWVWRDHEKQTTRR